MFLLPPDKACNAAGLYSIALRLFDELTAAASNDPYSDSDNGSNNDSEFDSESDYTGSDSDFADSDPDSDFTDSDPDPDYTGSDPESDDGAEVDRETGAPREARAGAEGVEEGEEGGQGDEGGEGEDWGMRFVGLIDIPDGELIPAAAATIALESCFLGGSRDQAMEIVWQVGG